MSKIIISPKIPCYSRLCRALDSNGVAYKDYTYLYGRPHSVILSYNMQLDFSYVYKWVFFLKDYGLEYVRPMRDDLKLYGDSPIEFLFGDNVFLETEYNYFKELAEGEPKGYLPIHISEFLTFRPNSDKDSVLKNCFDSYYYHKERKEKHTKKLKRLYADPEARKFLKEQEMYLRMSYEDDIEDEKPNYSRDTLIYGFEGDAANSWNID